MSQFNAGCWQRIEANWAAQGDDRWCPRWEGQIGGWPSWDRAVDLRQNGKVPLGKGPRWVPMRWVDQQRLVQTWLPHKGPYQRIDKASWYPYIRPTNHLVDPGFEPRQLQKVQLPWDDRLLADTQVYAASSTRKQSVAWQGSPLNPKSWHLHSDALTLAQRVARTKTGSHQARVPRITTRQLADEGLSSLHPFPKDLNCNLQQR